VILKDIGFWGRAHLLDQAFDEAVNELTEAITLNANFANGQYSLGYALQFPGTSSEGFPHVDKAFRLSPYDSMRFAFMGARAHLSAFTGDYDAAARWAVQAASQPNAHCHIVAIAIWCNALAGRHDIAQRYLTRLRREWPDYERAAFFRAFPFRAHERQIVETAFISAGL
jgi:tetratricopeptide (TPR) repeat protein